MGAKTSELEKEDKDSRSKIRALEKKVEECGNKITRLEGLVEKHAAHANQAEIKLQVLRQEMKEMADLVKKLQQGVWENEQQQSWSRSSWQSWQGR